MHADRLVQSFDSARMKYAGFWQRFCAGWIDFFVLLLPTVLLAWVGSLAQPLALVCDPLSGLLGWFYTFLFHAATGQTIGKRALGIRVVRPDGSRIGRREAFLRSAVDLLFTVVWIVGRLWGIWALSRGKFSTAGWGRQQLIITLSMPHFFRWMEVASTIWVCSEVFTMLFNRRKRAIHDFIAGTVVVNERPHPTRLRPVAA